jgi:hypothetical protein
VEQVAPGKNWPVAVGQLAAVEVMHAPVAMMQHAPGGVHTPAAVQGVFAVQLPLHADGIVCEQPPVAGLQHAPKWAQGTGLQVMGAAYQMEGGAHWVWGAEKHAPVWGLQQVPLVVVGQGVGLQVPP